MGSITFSEITKSQHEPFRRIQKIPNLISPNLVRPFPFYSKSLASQGRYHNIHVYIYIHWCIDPLNRRKDNSDGPGRWVLLFSEIRCDRPRCSNERCPRSVFMDARGWGWDHQVAAEAHFSTKNKVLKYFGLRTERAPQVESRCWVVFDRFL